MPLAERRHDADWIRALARHRGAWTNIHQKKSDRDAMLQSVSLPARNFVERFFDKIKHCRRLATRYDTFAASSVSAGRLDRAKAQRLALRQPLQRRDALRRKRP
jgi:transposase